MKICIMNNLYRPYSRGGAERIVEIIANEFVKNNDSVVIITTKPVFCNKSKVTENNAIYIRSLYLDLKAIPRVFKIFWHLFNIFNISKYFKIYNILNNEKPDMVITNNLVGLGFLTPFAVSKYIKKSNKKIKHIHILHDIQLLHPSGLMLFGKEKIVDGFFAKVYQKINIKLFENISIVISPSEWLLNLHKKKSFFNNAKSTVVRNPVEKNLSVFKSLSKFKKPFKLLYVGHISKEKGAFFLIDSLKNKEDFTLVMAGNFDKSFDIKSVPRNVKMIGFVSGEEIKKNMTEADVLVVPSLCYENSSTVIYEAAQIGLPVLASKIGGNIELVNDFGGILFEPGNKVDFYEKLLFLINKKNQETKNLEGFEKIDDYESSKYIKKIKYL